MQESGVARSTTTRAFWVWLIHVTTFCNRVRLMPTHHFQPSMSRLSQASSPKVESKLDRKGDCGLGEIHAHMPTRYESSSGISLLQIAQVLKSFVPICYSWMFPMGIIAPARSAPIMFVSCISARVRSAPRKSAPRRSVRYKFAPLRFALNRFAPER